MLSWDRSALTSTGLKLDGDLAVIDVDVSEAALVDALAGALDESFPELFARGLVRHAGGPKEAWIARVDEPFRRLASRRWYRGSDPDDPAVPKHHGRMLRLARDAAVRDRRAACPQPPGRGDQHLPVCRRRLAGDDAAGVAAGAAEGGLRAGLRPVRRDRRGGGAHRRQGDQRAAGARLTPRCFELDADTEIETRDHGAMTVAELERLMRARQGARQCAGDAALLGQLPRSDAGADGLASHQLGPLRPRHLRHHDGNDLAPARASAVRAVRIFGSITSKEPVPMNEHCTPKASPNTFDGDAISRADREFLASLGDHPLVRHPLYSVPPPPRPNYDGCTTIDERTEAQQACFPAALDWMLVNYAYYTGAFMGKGGIISLVDGEICTIASLRGFMQPYTIVEEGPRGGLKKTSVVDVWMTHPLRAQIDAIQCPSRQAAADVRRKTA